MAALSFETLARQRVQAPQRLCSLSSGLPWFFVPEHGVEDGEKLAGDSDESDHFEFTLGKQVLIKFTQYAIATDRGHRCHEDGSTNAGAAASNLAVTFPLARLSDERGDSDQACNLTAGQPTEFGEVGHWTGQQIHDWYAKLVPAGL